MTYLPYGVIHFRRVFFTFLISPCLKFSFVSLRGEGESEREKRFRWGTKGGSGKEVRRVNTKGDKKGKGGMGGDEVNGEGDRARRGKNRVSLSLSLL